jgi:hypothetical protein
MAGVRSRGLRKEGKQTFIIGSVPDVFAGFLHETVLRAGYRVLSVSKDTHRSLLCYEVHHAA